MIFSLLNSENIMTINMQTPEAYRAVVFCSGKPSTFIVGADLKSVATFNSQARYV